MEQQLRAAIQSDGRSINALARLSGVPQSTLARWWASPGSSIAMRHVNALCDLLGLELREVE